MRKAPPRLLARSRSGSEENDSGSLKLYTELSELDSNSALQVFDEMIWHEEFFFWSWDLVR